MSEGPSLEKLIEQVQFLENNIDTLRQAPEEYLRKFLVESQAYLEQLVDDGQQPEQSVEEDDDPDDVLAVVNDTLELVLENAARGPRVLQEVKEPLQKWLDNNYDASFEKAPENATRIETLQWIGRLGEVVTKHPTEQGNVFWHIQAHVNTETGEGAHRKERSRSASRKRASIADQPELKEPEIKAEPSTPSRKPTKPALKERPKTPEKQGFFKQVFSPSRTRGRETKPKDSPTQRPRSSPPRLRSPPPVQSSSKEELQESEEEDPDWVPQWKQQGFESWEAWSDYQAQPIEGFTGPGRGYGRHPRSPPLA